MEFLEKSQVYKKENAGDDYYFLCLNIYLIAPKQVSSQL